MQRFDFFREYWEEISKHLYNYFFILTSIVGSIVGLRGEKGLSLLKAIVIFLTGNISCLMLVILLDYYWKPGVIVLGSVAYFLGMIGNKITIAFIDFIDSFIRDPKKTILEIVDIIKSILSIKK